MDEMIWDEHDLAAEFAKRVVENIGPENAELVDRMNRSGVYGKYCASFDYCKPVEIINDAIDFLGMNRQDWDSISEAWRICTTEGFVRHSTE